MGRARATCAFGLTLAMREQWVGYGRPAAEALRMAIARAKDGEPLHPVTVIVPSNHVGVAARRLLASGKLGPVCGQGKGLAAVTFLTVYRLAELLGAPRLAASGRRPVSTPVIAAALRASLAADAGVFRAVASHPATETALVAAYRELRDLSPPALAAVAATSRRASDVVRLHRDARSRLQAAWYDEEDLMAAATAAAAAGGGVGDVIVFLPQRLSRHATELLTALADLAVIAGTTGDAAADATVRDSVARLGGRGPGHDAGGAAASAGGAGPVGSAGSAGGSPAAVRVVSTSDADEEVRVAVRATVAAMRAGTPLDRIAILHAGAEPYARLAHEQLGAASIPVNGASVTPLRGRVAGRALLGLLALPGGNFRRQDVLAWMAAAPLRHRGRPIPVAAWERVSRNAGVVAGRRDWDGRLARLASELDVVVAQLGADQTDADAEDGAAEGGEDGDNGSSAGGGATAWRARRAAEDAASARNLRRFVLDLIDDLDAAARGPRRWAEHVRWARRLGLVGTDPGELGSPGGREGGRRLGWPSAEVEATRRVDRALDRLGALDQVEGPVDVDVFGRTLELELDADLGRVGRFGEGVLVGPISMGLGLDLDLVIILGLVEGTFPATLRDDSLLPDHERATAGGELELRRDHVDRQHRWLLAAVAGAREAMLGVPRGDLRRSSSRTPSRWVGELARPSERNVVAGSVVHVPSFHAGLCELTFPATAQEHRLRSLLSDPAAARSVPGADVIAARRSEVFTRFDGNLAGLDIPRRTETSATRLQRWVRCPFEYFMVEVLGVDTVDHPEDQLQIPAVVRGELIHAALERFVTDVLAGAPREAPGPDDPWSEEDRKRMIAIAEDVCAEYEARGLTGRAVFWRRDQGRITTDLLRFLDADSEFRRFARTRIVAAELEFRSAAFPLPDGRVVSFRGKADRIDEAEDGTLHILDYKTGKADGYTRLSEANPDDGGRLLQLPIYGLAFGPPGREVEAAYWFVSGVGGFQRKGYRVTTDVIARVGERLALIVDGIAGGVFPHHPTEGSASRHVGCPFCDPDGLGVTELRRAWDRKRKAFAVYAEMAEPTDASA